MYNTTLVKRVLLLLVLTFVCLGFSACMDGSYQSGSDYKSMAWNDAVNAGIPAQLFVNQINQESGFNPSIVSSEGAEGIAQIMPATAKSWGVDPWNPVNSLQASASHMAWYQNHYGSFEKALACYNGGCGRLEWAMANCVNYYYCLYPETQRYITAIMG